MIGALKWAIPFYWPFAVPKLAAWVFKKAWQTYKALPRPKNPYLRWGIAEPAIVFVAIPGSVPWLLFQIGKAIGLEEELVGGWNICWNFFVDVLGILFSFLLSIGSDVVSFMYKAAMIAMF